MSTSSEQLQPRNVRFNYAVNTIEAGFMGITLGVASYITVIPLFVASLTDSGILIGLISAMRIIGWQLPQLLTVNYVARLRRYKPMVMLMTLNERLPFFALAFVALAYSTLGREVTLILTFTFVIWQSLGAGLTNPAWISMTSKVIPDRLHGMFYGFRGSASNLLSGGGALIAGLILASGTSAENFALCFLLAGICTMFSFGFMALTREVDSPVGNQVTRSRSEFWRGLKRILRRDTNFRNFVFGRMLAQITTLGTAFFTIYAVRRFEMDGGTAGIMTGVLLLAQVFANPIFGWLGDRISHRLMYGVGALICGAGAILAMVAPSLEWFYLVFALTGISNAGFMTTIYALSVEFGTPAERPYYIGLGNTLVAPAALIAPLLGGWLADNFGYQVTFGVAALSGILTALVVSFAVREPRGHVVDLVEPAVEPH